MIVIVLNLIIVVTHPNHLVGVWPKQVMNEEVGRVRPFAAVTPGEQAAVQGQCVLVIYTMTAPEFFGATPMYTSSIILGTPFLRAYHTVCRSDGPDQASVGFAASTLATG